MLNIGEIIKVYRIERGISQEELAYGICSTSNLSRIESGEQNPTRATYEAIMQRMGLDSSIYPSFLNEEEVEIQNLKHDINEHISWGMFEKAEEIVNKLESKPRLGKTHKTFVLFVRAIIARNTGATPEEVLDSMKEVVNSSIKNFKANKILNCLLTKNEISMLNNLAISYYKAGQEDEAIEVAYAAKEYIEKKVVDHEGIAGMYLIILYNLSKWIGLKGKHHEVIELCDMAIKRCKRYGKHTSLAGLLLNKGCALTMLNQREEAKKLLEEAYYSFRAVGEMAGCESVKKFADKHDISIVNP